MKKHFVTVVRNFSSRQREGSRVSKSSEHKVRQERKEYTKKHSHEDIYLEDVPKAVMSACSRPPMKL